jgi:hypothetical protein
MQSVNFVGEGTQDILKGDLADALAAEPVVLDEAQNGRSSPARSP